MKIMPRKVVPLVTGETYHVFNRGVDKRKVFLDKADYFRFHKSLQLFNAENQAQSIYELRFKEDWIENQRPLVNIHAYCLLGNHYHLLLTQKAEGGISEFMKRLGGGYTSYFNERYGRSGCLFQGKFKRVHVASNEQLLYLAAYVNLNNEVHSSKDYFLSSLGTYMGERTEPFVNANLILEQFEGPPQFKADSIKIVRQIYARRTVDKEYDRTTLLE